MGAADQLDVPVLTGAGVILRPFRADDVDAVLEAATDPLIPLISTVPNVADRNLAFAFIERQHRRATSGTGYSFAVADASDRCVGQIGLWLHDIDQGRAAIGYWIRPSARGQGLAAAALRCLTAWAMSLNEIHRLQLYVEPHNRASWRTAESAGFEREGLLRSWEYVGDERRDMHMYALVRSDL